MSPQAERRRESSYRRGMAARRRGIGQCCRAGRTVKAERTECALLRTQDADAPMPVRPKEVPSCPPRRGRLRLRALVGAGNTAGRSPAHRAAARLELRRAAPIRVRTSLPPRDGRGLRARTLRRGRSLCLVPKLRESDWEPAAQLRLYWIG